MWKNQRLNILAGLFAAAMTVLAVIGAIRMYSPIPHWDMWDGTLQFYLDVQDGVASAWWRQHNEHRVLLSRVLFWLDYRYFGGISIFLIAMNYVIVAAAIWVFWIVLRDTENGGRSVSSRNALALFIAGALFFWSQDNNLTWGFQSQFFLAQLLPMCGLVWLGRSIQRENSTANFALACAFGVLATGTMANGVLALPLMVVCALVLRLSPLRIVILVVLAALCLTAYFATYLPPPFHGHLSDALRDQPIRLIVYTMMYLGSPFYFMTGKGVFGMGAAAAAGSVLALGSVWLSLRLVRNARQAPISIALLLFILYIGGSAFGTAGGRLIFGMESATSSRYTTPALMAWLAFTIVLYLNSRLSRSARGAKSAGFVFVVAAILMLSYQVRAARGDVDMLQNREIAALALELGIKDQEFISQVYPKMEEPLAMASAAQARGLTVFGRFPYRGLKAELGADVASEALAACSGRLETVTALPEDAGYWRVSGWIFNDRADDSPKLVKILENNSVIGFALTGKPRRDLASSVSKSAVKAGFVGYLKRSDKSISIRAVGVDVPCQLDLGKISPAQIGVK
ncbi:hypothetical protein LMG3431_04696 [Achromobacter pestifer]|uniref:Uncharacterized protein n=2 Tax=Achromobacter pestifer TaxID=1353889 RepID=A0A6S6ZV44_9BURK|nr:hypothetical protein LMG3431_04696 [Achromobacter pestifer]